MRKIFHVIIYILLTVCSLIACEPKNQLLTSTSQDSTIKVIGFFSKNDTLNYTVQFSEYKITDSDSIINFDISYKTRLTVVDSTSEGYQMEYTLLEITIDSIVDSAYGNYLRKWIEYNQNIEIGTTVRFETNRFGRITKINNIDEIKKHAESLHNEGVRNILELSNEDAINELGYDIEALHNMLNLNSDQIVNNYTEELDLLFDCHGRIFNIGMTTSSEEATDSTTTIYSIISAEADTTYNAYHITAVNGSRIPLHNIAPNTSLDDYYIYISTYETYILGNGWPLEICRQIKYIMPEHCREREIFIQLESFSNEESRFQSSQ